ncbi:MAG: 16S rRNA (adenine(1518)-N(6)/adenine(1519)-N(6))-dimethyltransferase RsmA [Myxococcota bacterium]
MTWKDPRGVLARHGFRPSRRHSQNFLTSESVVHAIARATLRESPPLVVEIGPGVGTLTQALLEGAKVIALEKDRRMLDVLRTEFADEANLQVVEGDATKLDLAALTDRAPCTVAGNLPYAITGAILRALVEQRSLVNRAVIMIQREVRDRLRAKEGTKAYGALSVFTQNAYDVSDVCSVPPRSFFPPPKVHSAVVALQPRSSPRATETTTFRNVVQAAFGQRRKTLRNSLRSRFDADAVDAALARAEIDPKRRGETLSIESFGTLATLLDEGTKVSESDFEETT